jgi:hypothetical protein
MSSQYVRQGITNFINAELTTENLIDLTADYAEIQDLLEENSLSPRDTWLGLQFVGSEEIPVDVGAINTRGKYREIGVIYLHVVDVAKLNVHNSIIARAEAVRNAFRGRRIADTILIEGVSPVNFGGGATLSFTGGYTAGLIQIDYRRDLDL